MEPIRSRETGRFRQKTSSGNRSDSSGSKVFQRSLDRTEQVEGTGQDTAAAADMGAILAGLPGVDASTESLFDAVHSAGQRLQDEKTYTAVQHYREAVRRFLGKVLADANAVEIHESRRDLMSRKRYYLLTEINQSVDRLLKGLMTSQMPQMEILSRLEEIEGMLVDLFQ